MAIQDGKPCILYAEDSPLIRKCIYNYLISIGCQVDIAVTGGEAWEKYRNNPYDIILLDGAMPEATGWEVGKRIREHEKQNKLFRIPLLLLSAYPRDKVESDCQAAGIDEFLLKPVVLDDLRAMLDRWLVHQGKSPTHSPNDGQASNEDEELVGKHHYTIKLASASEHAEAIKKIRKQHLEAVGSVPIPAGQPRATVG